MLPHQRLRIITDIPNLRNYNIEIVPHQQQILELLVVVAALLVVTPTQHRFHHLVALLEHNYKHCYNITLNCSLNF